MKRTIFAALVFCASGGALAADSGIYLGASVGQSDVTVSANSGLQKFDGKDFAYKIIVGVRPIDRFSAEVSYVDLGKPDDRSLGSAADTKGVSGFAVGYAPLGPVDLFAKAGLVNWDATLSSHGVRVTKKDGTDFAYGAGAQFRLLSLGIRAEYERFEIEKGANMLSLGATWTFL